MKKEYDIEFSLLDPNVFKHASEIFINVVKPYNREIRLLLKNYNLTSEGDLFNSTCEFANITHNRNDAFDIQDDIR